MTVGIIAKLLIDRCLFVPQCLLLDVTGIDDTIFRSPLVAFIKLSEETRELSYKELCILLMRTLSHLRYAQHRTQSMHDRLKVHQTITMRGTVFDLNHFRFFLINVNV